MSGERASSLVRLLVLSVGLVAFVTPAAAQQPQPPDVPQFSFIVEAALSMLVTLVVGVGLIGGAPEYTDRTTGRIIEQPTKTLWTGIVLTLALVIGFGGILFVSGLFGVWFILLPLLFIAAIGVGIVFLVVSQIGYLAVGRVLAPHWLGALLVALVVSGLTAAVPYAGAFVGFLLLSLGVGSVFLERRSSSSGSGYSSEQGHHYDSV